LFGMPVLEHVSANLPSARAVSTARMIFDPRKSAAEKAINLVSGVKTTTLSPYQKRKAARESIQTMAERGRYGGLFKSPRIDRIRLVELLKDGKISEKEFRDALLAQSELNKIAREAQREGAKRKIERISSFSSLP